MQTPNFRRVLALLTSSALFTACGSGVNPYAKIQNPPLLSATLHTVTLVSDDAAFAGQLRDQGYTPLTFASNYPASVPVEAALWNVPVPVAAKPAEFTAPAALSPGVRLLVMPLAAHGLNADPATETDFYRRVLGVDVPRWPAAGNLPGNVRVKVWTYLIPNLLEANRKIRANGIPVIFDPVAITTAYLGGHKTMAIRAPDGTVVQLVETSAQ